MKRAKGIMYAQRWIESSLAFALATCLLAACASQPTAVERPAGYWSQVEDFGANPPPESVVNAAISRGLNPAALATVLCWSSS